MESTERLLFIVALIAFLIAVQTRRRTHAYVGATMVLFVLLGALANHPLPPAQVAQTEQETLRTLIDQVTKIDNDAHKILSRMPHTKSQAIQAQVPNGAAARFYAEERDWLNRAEQGKPLSNFIDQNAGTAAIRIVAVDSFLTGAVESAVENCNGRDADANMDLADRIIADAKASLYGKGDPHFPTPDLSKQLDGQDECEDDGSGNAGSP